MTTEQPKPAAGKSSLGLDENIGMLLAYLAGWLTGIIFYVLEKENRNVKFAAMQSIVTFGGITALWIALMIVGVIVGWVPVVGHVMGWILGGVGWLAWVGGVILMIILIVKSLQGEVYKVPYAGEMAEKYVK